MIPLSKEEWALVLKLVEEMIPTVDKHQDSARPPCGGVWVLAWNRQGREATLLQARVGQMTDESSGKRQRVSRMKIAMLNDNPNAELSYELRNPDLGLWGGGVNLNRENDFSISGFPEPADTAGVLYFLGRLGKIDRYEAYRLATKADKARDWLVTFEACHGLFQTTT